MTLRHMKIFVTVCREDSISKAARKLYISQPAVSNAVKELEEYYGTPLFDRISKKLFLTQAGQTLYDYAIHISSLFDELESELKASSNHGRLKVGASITIGTHIMPELVKAFKDKNPDVTVFVAIDSSDNIEKLVLSNELDFALIEGLVHSSQLESIDFIKDELIVISSTNHRLCDKKNLTLRDISGEDFIMRERNSGTREVAESILSTQGIVLNPAWESTSTEAIIHAVSKNLGISILPMALVQEYIDNGLVSRLNLKNISFIRDYHIIHHRNKYLTAPAKSFIELCTLKSPF